MKRTVDKHKPRKNRTKENDRHMGKQQQYPILDEQKTFNFPMACRQQ